MNIKAFFDHDTSTLTYVVSDPATKEAAIIDPVLDYDPMASRVTKDSLKTVIQYVQESNLKPLYVLETHAHADHLSSSQFFKDYFSGIKVMINERICIVQKTFRDVFNLEKDFQIDGSQFDGLLKMEETYSIGNLKFKVLPTPGHTPACSSYIFESGNLFSGDAIFMPDSGTGRCDFPMGSASDLYDSITQKIYSLPKETRIFVGHDYQPNGRGLAYQTSVGEEKSSNIQLRDSTSREEFIKFRTERDKTLDAPRLLYQSVQFNIRAGHWPPEESNGSSYLKMPLTMG
ncbi:MAG: MBL fold metallo-hydrolase [Bdellovibrionota bacterium]